MNKLLFIVFFLIIISSISLFNIYGNMVSKKGTILLNEKIDKVLYQFFSDLINEQVINHDDILNITKNKDGEILIVNYDIENSYKMLAKISNIIKKGINDLEYGSIDVHLYDEYLDNGPKGLILNVPLFIASNNMYLNNLGPKIPIKVNFNETLLTNIKTKVTNYGFNNALLEVYITLEMHKLIITPVKKYDEIFTYDVLINAMVINGRVPEFYGPSYEANSNILDIPIN